jgi:hypothetical protein
MPLFSLLINTTDSFEDCWLPFFDLFRKYWPDFKGTVYLNTEKKSFTYNELKIISIKNNIKTPDYKPTWSECLLRALYEIPDSIVLYMQEDYFLHDYVKSTIVDELVHILTTTEIDCIHLTDQATPGPFCETKYQYLLEIERNAPYRISTQAALWKKEALKQYIRKHENAWQFEHFGTRRARIINHCIYNVNVKTFKKDINEIIPYIFTGIIKGKWNREMIELADKEGLKIEFSIRSFYQDKASDSIIKTIKNKFSFGNLLSPVISEIGIIFLRFKLYFVL